MVALYYHCSLASLPHYHYWMLCSKTPIWDLKVKYQTENVPKLRGHFWYFFWLPLGNWVGQFRTLFCLLCSRQTYCKTTAVHCSKMHQFLPLYHLLLSFGGIIHITEGETLATMQSVMPYFCCSILKKNTGFHLV